MFARYGALCLVSGLLLQPQLHPSDTTSAGGIPFTTSGAFTQTQRDTLEGARRILEQRMLAKRVIDAADREIHEGSCYRVRNRARMRLGVSSNREVLRTQLFHLAALAEQNRFPGVSIVPYDGGRIDIVGEAEVETIWFDSAGRPTGRFSIKVSSSALDAAPDSEYWAGVIAHEMLHNLGHTHPGVDDRTQYGCTWQIVVFQAAVECDGDLERMDLASAGRCGFVKDEECSVSVEAAREGWTKISALDWGWYTVVSSGEIHYSSGNSHNCTAEGDHENSKRYGGYRLGQLLIRLPSGRVIPYEGQTQLLLDQGDAIEFRVNDRDGQYGDNRNAFSVTARLSS